MVDATDLKSVARKGVRVRVSPSAPFDLLSNDLLNSVCLRISE